MNKKWEKMKKKTKTKKKDKKKREKKKVGKKGKEGPKGFHPRRLKRMFFHIRTVKRNRNEIEAQKIRFWAPKKDKENERKWKMEKMKNNEKRKNE